MKPYAEETEQIMQQFYTTLSEKNRRRYAAIEAHKLGYGGINYIAGVLGCHKSTIQAGLKELRQLPESPEMVERIRKPGGGRKSYAVTYPDIDEQFLRVLRDHTAGDPMAEDVLWTDLTQAEIAEHLAQEYDVVVSTQVIRQLLKKHKYRRRKAQKKRP
jgi:transposase